MSLCGCPQQHVVDPSLGPILRVLGNPDALGNLVGRGEADAVNVFGQGVWVLPNVLNGPFSIGLVNSDGSPGTDSVAVQKEHDLPDLHSVLPGAGNPLAALWADSIDRFQVSGTVPNHAQHFRPEASDQLLRQDWANPLHKSASKISFNTFARVGRNGFQHLGFELETVLLIPDPPAFCGQPLPSAYGWQ